jgi:ribosomal protein S18 acetylase RimI-like enzyme
VSQPLVRDFTAADWAAVAEVWRETGMGRPERGDTLATVERTLSAGGRLLLLEADGVVVGTSWLTVDGRRSYLHHFGIRPSHQRRGLGRHLLSATLAAAREIGLQVKLEVHRDNLDAIRLYTQAGFTALGDYDVYIIRALRQTNGR